MVSQILFAACTMFCIQKSPAPDPMVIVQPIELRQMLETGKFFKPWVLRIRNGDPWAMAELVLICESSRSYLDCGMGPMAEAAKPGLERLRTSDPGRACYYLAEMVRITGDSGKRERPYIALLEESSRYGYPWANLKLYEESRQGGAYSRIKITDATNQIEHKVEVAKLEAKYKEKAFQSLLPLAMKGDVEARQQVYALQESRFDHLLDKAQARALLEDSANHGSILAQIQIEELKLSDSNPGHFVFPLVEGSPLFRVMERAADQYDPPSIQMLVDYYVEKKEWATAKKWANKGKEALGGTNRWLEKAWSDINPPEDDD